MNIALWGYGKMGKTIEKIAKERGNTISAIIDLDTDPNQVNWSNIDVVIEFTQPESAFDNISFCLNKQKAVISGTTGWLDQKEAVEALCRQREAAFFYASNFSIGVNLFFKLNEQLAKLMNKHEAYEVSMEEIHHIHKKDSPSGTGITLAEGIIKHLDRKRKWHEEGDGNKESIKINTSRMGEVPGTHSVIYKSAIDEIKITHEAYSREGFAKGAVLVAEWIKDKKGVLSMDDFLSL